MASIRWAWGYVALLVLSVSAPAQFRGGIQGTILDPTGAAVPGAKVTLQDEETGASQESISGPEGFYRFSGLRPGRYTITVEMAGFQKAVHEHVIVRAEQLEGLNITLSPGQVTESITVSAEAAPPLQTENANIDAALTARQVTRLPQFQRDPYELLRLAPGVFGTGARDGGGNSVALPNSAGPGGSNNSIFQTENQVPISANGQRLTANGFQIDGVNVNSQAWGGAAIITPTQEAVKEIRVVSSSYSAENGRNTGALIQVVSQNGTNEFHGSFVGRFGRPELNAFQRWGGPHGETPQRVGKTFNQWAGSAGGPVVKNRLFFFFAYERIGFDNRTNEPQWVETPEFVDRV
ncbi:MAG: TonB-dependent receptor, partial [Bryobacteraceae bacterium]|nr:TonB-dependent receptor [Bryobacteraceae bacterium]